MFCKRLMKKECRYCEDYDQKNNLLSDVFLGFVFITDDFMPKIKSRRKIFKKDPH